MNTINQKKVFGNAKKVMKLIDVIQKEHRDLQVSQINLLDLLHQVPTLLKGVELEQEHLYAFRTMKDVSMSLIPLTDDTLKILFTHWKKHPDKHKCKSVMTRKLLLAYKQHGIRYLKQELDIMSGEKKFELKK